jgi:hypothetical protein
VVQVDTTPDDGFVYFAQAGICGPIKIGRAVNVTERISKINTISPVPVRLLAVIPGGGQEAELHTKFARWRYHGEWFMPCGELIDFIRSHAVLSRSFGRMQRSKRLHVAKEFHEMPAELRIDDLVNKSKGRRDPWFRSDRGAWYTTIGGRQVKLTPRGGTLEDAELALAKMLNVLSAKAAQQAA